MNVPEKLLHYVWQQRLFIGSELVTTTGQKVEILNTGRLNTDAGPDFFNAQVRIDGTHWAGNIEIHTDANDWFAHGHHTDAAYDNVVLHLVSQPSAANTVTSSGREVPQCVLVIPQHILSRYQELVKKRSLIRCAELLPHIPALKRHLWLQRLLTERFEQFEARVQTYLAQCNGDWDQAFFCLLARAMGTIVNAEPMEMLARRTPVRILIKHPDPLQAEALLLGQSGLLHSITNPDEYTLRLQREYDFLRAKFGLEPMNHALWKYLRLRPQNFPDVRIAQLAAIVLATPGNFESAFRTLNVHDVEERLSVKASQYWDSHYILSKPSDRIAPKKLGPSQRKLLIINAIVPFVFSYARRFSDEQAQANTLRFMEFLPPEENSVLTRWAQAGLPATNEGEAQALLLLTKEYCRPSKCFACMFGHVALSQAVQ